MKQDGIQFPNKNNTITEVIPATWTLCKVAMPPKEGKYWVTVLEACPKENITKVDQFWFNTITGFRRNVIAWAPLNTPDTVVSYDPSQVYDEEINWVPFKTGCKPTKLEWYDVTILLENGSRVAARAHRSRGAWDSPHTSYQNHVYDFTKKEQENLNVIAWSNNDCSTVQFNFIEPYMGPINFNEQITLICKERIH